ncbi:helix-turn-helix transcriptional regulator [Streptomyces cinereoruber]|uniref:helix-turn-helix transcriptional regulator n=1 Tax=Streptomyces cinereoruber TaxID=67260 RepID=UPI003392E0FD
MITIKQIAEEHGVSRSSVHTYRRRPTFPQPVPVEGSTRIQYRSDEVAAWFEENPPQPGKRTDLASRDEERGEPTTMDYQRCGVRGTLSDADAMKLQNLAFTTAIHSWEDRNLTCELPEGHSSAEHVAQLATQNFEEPVVWWASWLDIDELRDAAALFTGPVCGAVDPAPGREEWDCVLLQGHMQSDDDQHVYR